MQDVCRGSRDAEVFSSLAPVDPTSQEFPEKDEDEADDAEEEL